MLTYAREKRFKSDQYPAASLAQVYLNWFFAHLYGGVRFLYDATAIPCRIEGESNFKGGLKKNLCKRF